MDGSGKQCSRASYGPDENRKAAKEMSSDDISIAASGLVLLGHSLGLAPKASEFEEAIKNEKTRSIPPLRGRQLRICDDKGLSWMVDLQLGTVVWLDVQLGPVEHRKATDHDPSGYFAGRLIIDRCTVRGCFSLETGEIIRKLSIPDVGLLVVPEGKTVRAVLIAFSVNERDSDAALEARNN